jgi:ankyrin repeat protein
MPLELFDLAKNRQYETLLRQLEHEPSLLSEQHPVGYNLIHLLAETAPLSVFQKVVNLGGDIHKLDSQGETPFCWALDDDNFDVAKFLISKRVEINVQNSDGLFPIHVAALEGNREAIAFLIEHGVQIDQESQGKATALHFATLAGNTELIEYLLSFGAHINAQDISGKTPLHWALLRLTVHRQANIQIIECLAKHGANLDATTVDDNTSWSYARLFNTNDYLKVLLKYGTESRRD